MKNKIDIAFGVVITILLLGLIGYLTKESISKNNIIEEQSQKINKINKELKEKDKKINLLEKSNTAKDYEINTLKNSIEIIKKENNFEDSEEYKIMEENYENLYEACREFIIKEKNYDPTEDLIKCSTGAIFTGSVYGCGDLLINGINKIIN